MDSEADQAQEHAEQLRRDGCDDEMSEYFIDTE